jgi:hypothetical protein
MSGSMEGRTDSALGRFQLETRRCIAPYVFSEFPKSLDGFEHLAVVGRGVRAREDPDLQSRVVTFVAGD